MMSLNIGPGYRKDRVDLAADFSASFSCKADTDMVQRALRDLGPEAMVKVIQGLHEYVQHYTGSFDLIRDYARYTDRPLSPNQLRVVVNTIRGDLARAQHNQALTDRERTVAETATFVMRESVAAGDRVVIYPDGTVGRPPTGEAPAPSSVTPVVPDGYYTVVWPDGKHTTLRLAIWEKEGIPEGVQVAGLLVGSDNMSDYRGFARVDGDRYRVWGRSGLAEDSRPVQALRLLLSGSDGWREAGKAYTMRSKRCFVCHRTLTNPESVQAGIGPECASRVAF